MNNRLSPPNLTKKFTHEKYCGRNISYDAYLNDDGIDAVGDELDDKCVIAPEKDSD